MIQILLAKLRNLFTKKSLVFRHGDIVQFDYDGMVNAWVERAENTNGYIDLLLFILSSEHAGEMIWVPANCIKRIVQ